VIVFFSVSAPPGLTAHSSNSPQLCLALLNIPAGAAAAALIKNKEHCRFDRFFNYWREYKTRQKSDFQTKGICIVVVVALCLCW